MQSKGWGSTPQTLLDRSKLQWVCCHEGYGYLWSNLVKEISFLCLQTWRFHTFHILPPPNSKIKHDYANEDRRFVYDLQLKKHNIPWDDGEIDEEQLGKTLQYILTPYNMVFVMDGYLGAYLMEKYNIRAHRLSIPWKQRKDLPQCPKHTCKEYGHVEGFTYCAQRRCFELARYLYPLMVNYFLPELVQEATSLELYIDPQFKPREPPDMVGEEEEEDI
jgi:hypothetical protein